jgi:hypothetical protein
VAGDQNKVPPFTALVYQLEIIEIQKQQKWETFGWPHSSLEVCYRAAAAKTR